MIKEVLYILTLFLAFESTNYTVFANANENHPREDQEEHQNDETEDLSSGSPWDPR